MTEAAERLWKTGGTEALAYLRGRGLTDETIKAAHLGVVESVSIPTRDGDRCYQARGVVIPWFEGDRLTLVKIRQPEGAKPKYAEAFRDRPRIFPDREAIELGRPLVIAEGEFDAILLDQELQDLAAVVTLGSASNRPDPTILGDMLAVAPWFVATDADEAGDKAASGWPAAPPRPAARIVQGLDRGRLRWREPAPLVVRSSWRDRGPGPLHLGRTGRPALVTGPARDRARRRPRPLPGPGTRSNPDRYTY